jgi:DNA invertase Pin-like site-specific DNA recombinase
MVIFFGVNWRGFLTVKTVFDKTGVLTYVVPVGGTNVKAAIYARISKKDSKQDTENQTLQLRVYAEKMGWEIVEEYVDRASGKTADRAQFKRMFNDARNREFDVVLFWAIDRFSREGTYETLRHLKMLTDYGVMWRSHQEQYIDSTGPFAEAIIGFVAAIARQERVRLSERVKAGLERVRKNGSESGKPIGRPKAEDNDPKLMARFEDLHESGLSIRRMAVELGVSPNTVYSLMGRPRKRKPSPVLAKA